MGNIDEASQERETYGSAPGWSQGEKELAADAALPLGVKGARAESPTVDAEADSSPAQEEAPQEEVSQEATAPTSQPEPEKKFNMPPAERWEELRREKEEAKARADRADARAEQLAQAAIQRMSQQPQAQPQPEVDPYAGMDSATADFYRNMDRRIEQKAQMIADARMQPILHAADGLRRHQAEQDIKSFRAENPDIKPGSQEEAVIASHVQQGFDLNTAKKLAMYDKLETENRALKGKQAQVPQKRAAAQSDSSSGIPQTAGLPGRPGSWKDNVSSVHDKGGSFQDMLKAAFR